MQETKKTRVLLVDDHEVVRIGLKTLLSRFPEMEVVGEAATVAQATERAAELTPDVILLDVRLPDGSGFDACRKIQELPAPTHVLILTSFADDDTLFEAIHSGADGYLLKEINGETLINSIRKVSSGQSILDPAVTRRVLGRIRNPAGSSDKEKEKMSLLSTQERRVLALVAEGKTNKEIGVALNLSEKTVKNYLSNLFAKLQFTRRAQAAAFFVQNTSAPSN